MQNDPLLQPYQLKHLTLKNRLMISSHEPAYTDDGMLKQRYRLYHEARSMKCITRSNHYRVTSVKSITMRCDW